MGVIHRFGKTKLAVYPGDHGIAHVHVIGPDFKCSLDLESFGLLAGQIPPKALREVREWLAANRSTALEAWKELNG